MTVNGSENSDQLPGYIFKYRHRLDTPEPSTLSMYFRNDLNITDIPPFNPFNGPILEAK